MFCNKIPGTLRGAVAFLKKKSTWRDGRTLIRAGLPNDHDRMRLNGTILPTGAGSGLLLLVLALASDVPGSPN